VTTSAAKLTITTIQEALKNLSTINCTELQSRTTSAANLTTAIIQEALKNLPTINHTESQSTVTSVQLSQAELINKLKTVVHKDIIEAFIIIKDVQTTLTFTAEE